MARTKSQLIADKRYKAIGVGERTSTKVSTIHKSDGTTFKRKNANQYGPAEGGNDYTEKRPNRTDKYAGGGKTKGEIAYEQEQHDAMFNSQYGKGGGVLSNNEIMKDINFEDNTDIRLGRYDFSFSTQDSEGAEMLDYDGYIIEAPSSSRTNDEIEWGQNTPEDWETAEKVLLNAFYEWKHDRLKKYADGGGFNQVKTWLHGVEHWFTKNMF